MGIEILEPNTCIRGCCTSPSIPLHLPPSSYTLLSPIARGSESVVYEGTLDGTRVAVKKPILSTSEDINKFHKELQLLCKLDHPGIATPIAAHAKPPNYMFFFKLFESPNLAQKLHVEEWIPTLNDALMIAMQLAKALQYLHNLGIVHRDVKPANILLDKNLCPHLTDFGLAEYKNDLKRVSTENWKSSGKPTGGFHKKNMVGTLIYMAPEILRKELHTEKSDVYSFGISINELLTGVVPYTDLRTEAQAHTVLEMNYTEQQLTAAVVSDGLRPVLAAEDLGIPSRLLSMIKKCWDADPNNRPAFDDIVEELDLVMEHGKLKKAEDIHIRPYNLHVVQPAGKTDHFKAYQESFSWFTRGELLARSASSANDSGLITRCESSDKPSAYHPTMSWGSYATCGRRETMEDTHFILPHICDEKDAYAFGIFDGHRAPYDKNASLWWRDLKLALHQPSIQNVFRDGIAWKVGRGDKILFWEDNWLQGDAALVARYPRLYLNSCQQNHRIMDMGAQKDMGWEWNFKWRRHLFDSELDMAARFLCDVDDCHIQRNRMDEWIWKADPSGSYSTKSAYAEMWGEAAADNQVQDFEELWKLKIPPKVAVFAWRLFRDRLPTKSNLTRRNVALDDTSCPFCRRTEEDAAHLFLHCHKILPLWWESMAWVNILGVSPQYPRQHFSQHAAVMVKGIRQNRWKCWWMALTWAVWQQRNKILFSQQTFDGAAAAAFSSRAVPAVLQTSDFMGSPANALAEAFIKTDAAFRKELDSYRKSNRCIQKDWHPGCTAIAILIVRNKLFVANIGDCRVILCRAGNPIALSKDHVASCLQERERVIRQGGQVHWQVDTWRVGLPALQSPNPSQPPSNSPDVGQSASVSAQSSSNHQPVQSDSDIPIPASSLPSSPVQSPNTEPTDPSLPVTRSIGDDDLKPAVTAEPEITESTLCPEDEFLVMASDGLWDAISSMEVINIIKDTVKEPGMCSKRLATEAVERGSKDNITVIVVFLRPVSTAERIY
ncbi:Protein kinase and PP2C-like domain-containing protein [Glycine soja]